MKSEIEIRGAVIGKLKQDLSMAQHGQSMSAKQVKKLEIDKITLEMDKEVLEREKEELQKQLMAAGKREIGGSSVADWRKVAEFWSGVRAKTMMRNALCSPELKEWLLTLTTKYTDIGYTEGVTAVFASNQQRKKAAEFPILKKGTWMGQPLLMSKLQNCKIGL